MMFLDVFWDKFAVNIPQSIYLGETILYLWD